MGPWGQTMYTTWSIMILITPLTWLSPGEFETARNLAPSAGEIWAEVLHHVDRDGSGTVEWSETSAFVDHQCGEHGASPEECAPAKAYIKGEFDRIDTSGDGSVDKAEFKAEAAKHGVH